MANENPGRTVDLAAGPVVLRNGLAGEAVRIPTANPTGFYQALSEPDEMPATEILGSLFLPPGGGPRPVVIVVPGSLGVAPSHVAKADYLTDTGIACCVIDPFGTRGVTSTVANQAQYSFAASAWDVLATARTLAPREDIDATRIGAQGHSRGGSAVLSAACMTPLVGPARSPTPSTASTATRRWNWSPTRRSHRERRPRTSGRTEPSCIPSPGARTPASASWRRCATASSRVMGGAERASAHKATRRGHSTRT